MMITTMYRETPYGPTATGTALSVKRRCDVPINQEEMYPVYFTTGSVARYCGVSKVTVLRWIEKGNLAAFKLPGGQNRIQRNDFFTFARKHGIPIGNIPPK
jgi:excisionase family DNA binding protein